MRGVASKVFVSEKGNANGGPSPSGEGGQRPGEGIVGARNALIRPIQLVPILEQELAERVRPMLRKWILVALCCTALFSSSRTEAAMQAAVSANRVDDVPRIKL